MQPATIEEITEQTEEQKQERQWFRIEDKLMENPAFTLLDINNIRQIFGKDQSEATVEIGKKIKEYDDAQKRKWGGA